MAYINSHLTGLKSREAALLAERLGKMSHDFRSSLNIIIGFTELLLDEVPGKINDEQRRSLRDVLNSAQRMLVLVSEVLE